MWTDNTIFTDDINIIENFVAYRSVSMLKYLQKMKNKSTFTMWYKSLNHSDLPTRGKRTNADDSFEKNLLYYMTETGLVITRIKDLQIVNGGQTTDSIANTV